MQHTTAPAGFPSARWKSWEKRRMAAAAATESLAVCICTYCISFVWLVGCWHSTRCQGGRKRRREKLILRPDWIQPRWVEEDHPRRPSLFFFPTGDQNGGDGARYITYRERTIRLLLLFSVWLIAHLPGRVEEKSKKQLGGGGEISHAMVVLVEDESRAHPE